jgi:hypothetical protein
MKIEIAFKNPVNGWWDGGARSGGVFEEDRFHAQKGKTCFGCYMLNFFFNVKTGNTNKETVTRAKKWLRNHCKQPFHFVAFVA